MATVHLHPDFKDFLKSLNDRQVDYLLIGGYAVAFHGYPRPTGDLDVWIRATPDTDLNPEFFLPSPSLIRMGCPPYRIEISTQISGVEFETCWSNRVMGYVDDIVVPILGLSELRTNKRASGRLKDLADLDNLPGGP